MTTMLSQVLVVDDDPGARKLISALLQRIGLQSILVKDGPTALTLLDEGLLPSLVILDLTMPDMDGFAVLEKIRAKRDFDALPVLILSATMDPTAIRRALDMGADGYVTKAFMTQSLMDRVRVLIAAGRRPEPPTVRIARTSPLSGGGFGGSFDADDPPSDQ
ncbi:MAG: response regulator [Anaerolineae bacterium]|nr:response regulator [Anaerolineae bacterium]